MLKRRAVKKRSLMCGTPEGANRAEGAHAFAIHQKWKVRLAGMIGGDAETCVEVCILFSMSIRLYLSQEALKGAMITYTQLHAAVIAPVVGHMVTNQPLVADEHQFPQGLCVPSCQL